jgi:hypothetical protein
MHINLPGVRIQKGPKPLRNKTFYLDIKNHVYSSKLEAKIKELGGVSVTSQLHKIVE